MKKNIQRADERGKTDQGWLKANFSFSFSRYYNPDRVSFGKLVVLNDDTIAPGKGFGAHPHENMEVISIPTYGELTHKDNTGSEEVIFSNQIQVMSAGSGITHSEYNHSKSQEAKLFQIWIEPSKLNVEPRHETKTLNLEKNKIVKIVSGNKDKNTLFIYQDASVHLGEFDKNETVSFKTKENRGTFIMVTEGSAKIEGELLNKRDSIEIKETNEIKIETTKDTKILVIDTIMN